MGIGTPSGNYYESYPEYTQENIDKIIAGAGALGETDPVINQMEDTAKRSRGEQVLPAPEALAPLEKRSMSDEQPDPIVVGQQYAGMYLPRKGAPEYPVTEVDRAAGAGLTARGGTTPVMRSQPIEDAGINALRRNLETLSRVPDRPYTVPDRFEGLGQEPFDGPPAFDPNTTKPKGLTIKPSGDEAPNQFRFVDSEGKDVGSIQLTVKNKGRDLHVDMVDAWAAGGANSIGPTEVRSLLRQIKKEYPDAERLYGYRVSGARGAAGTRDDAFIALKPGIKNRPEGKAPNVTESEMRARENAALRTLRLRDAAEQRNRERRTASERINNMSPEEFTRFMEDFMRTNP